MRAAAMRGIEVIVPATVILTSDPDDLRPLAAERPRSTVIAI